MLKGLDGYHKASACLWIVGDQSCDVFVELTCDGEESTDSMTG